MKGLPEGLIDASKNALGGKIEDAIVVRQDLEENKLHGDQYKLDANENGKLDSHDFKLIRKKKQMKEALDRGVAFAQIVEIRAAGAGDLNGSIGQLVHFDRIKKIGTVTVEGRQYKLKQGSYLPISEQEFAEAKKMKGEDPCWDSHEMIGHKMKNGKKVPNCVPKEEVEYEDEEQIDELSKKTLGSYINKSANDAAKGTIDYATHGANPKGYKGFSKSLKRLKGIQKATDKLTKEDVEDEEQIDEISYKKATEYRSAAMDQHGNTFKGRGRKSAGTLKLRAKREDGIKKAEALIAKHNKAKWEAREKEMRKNQAEFSDHIEAKHNNILAKHGFELVNSGHHDNNRTGEGKDHVRTYIAHHDNGHSTMVSVVKRGGDVGTYFGSTHEIRAVNTKGTSWSSLNPYHNHGDDLELEHSKKKFDVDLHDHLKRITESGSGKGNW